MKLIIRVILLMINTSLFLNSVNAETLAETLGYAKDAKLLIIHADDGGLMQSVNSATAKHMKDGNITSASYMMPCPWIYQAADYFKHCQQCDVGIHVTLNSEWEDYRWGSVSPLDKVASLLEEDGTLWKTRENYLENARTSEAAGEINAQIQKAVNLGFRPSHIDSHMGTIFTKPDVLEHYVRLANQHKLIPMLPKWSEGLHAYLESLPYYDAPKLKTALLKYEQEGQVMIDRLILDAEGVTFEVRKRNYLNLPKSLQPGLNQLIVHLSDESQEFDTVIQQRGKEFRRYGDRKILQSPEFKKALEDEKIILISWKDIQKIKYQTD